MQKLSFSTEMNGKSPIAPDSGNSDIEYLIPLISQLLLPALLVRPLLHQPYPDSSE